MPASQASRRLVKSPPELWAEVSDAASLAKHLGEVGEITITRLEPETTVAWEGERASGTVELAPAGWGTSVTLTAEPVGGRAPAEPVGQVEVEPATAAEPEIAVTEPEPVAEVPEAEPVAEAPAEAEPVLAEPAASAPPRRSWLVRLFRRTPVEPSEPAAAEPPSVAPPVEPEPAPEPEPVADAAPIADAEPIADPLEAVLTGALDSLGQAHHRPFSRG
jgi:hypothetical protein